MTTPTRTRTIRSTGRRLVGAVSSALAVGIMGVTAISPQTAAAAGISTGHRHAASQPSAADPGPAPQPVDRSLGQPAHSTQPGSA